MSAETRKQVWVVDDDASVRKALRRLLKCHGFRVATFSSGSEAESQGVTDDIGCLVLDIAMPEEDGLEVYARMQECGCHAPAVFITAHANSRQTAAAKANGSLLRKPFDDHAILSAVSSAFSRA